MTSTMSKEHSHHHFIYSAAWNLLHFFVTIQAVIAVTTPGSARQHALPFSFSAACPETSHLHIDVQYSRVSAALCTPNPVLSSIQEVCPSVNKRPLPARSTHTGRGPEEKRMLFSSRNRSRTEQQTLCVSGIGFHVSTLVTSTNKYSLA